MILSKQQILEAKDLKREIVHVPEWGGDVIIQTMSGVTRNEWEQSLYNRETKEPDLVNSRAKLLSRCIVDEQGNRVFSESDVAALGAKSGYVLDRLSDVAQRVNGLGSAAEEDVRGN